MPNLVNKCVETFDYRDIGVNMFLDRSQDSHIKVKIQAKHTEIFVTSIKLGAHNSDVLPNSHRYGIRINATSNILLCWDCALIATMIETNFD